MKPRRQRSIQFVPLAALTGLVACGIYAQTVQNVPGWGAVTDPEGNSTFKTEKGKVTVTVPGIPHDQGSLEYEHKSAPRIMQEVDGDFSAQLKVSGDFNPGDKAAYPLANAFIGAGLLVWDSDKHHLQLERAVWITQQGNRVSYAPLLQYCKDGRTKTRGGTRAPFDKGRSTYLRMIRCGSEFSVAVSDDGTNWLASESVTTDLPKKVKIGVSAANTSKNPCTIEFDEFKLTTK